MKYMLMLYADEKVGNQIPPEQMAGFMDRMYAYRDALTKAGAFIATAPLAPTWDARTIRIDNGELKVHDGPYADTREQLGGYYRVYAKSLDEAIDMAARLPAVEHGSVEIRPVADMSAYA